ncbi:acyltransferase domain-containing protein [bacterium]|nr:acyltransferase domain-containing protein [bacterium]
MSKLSFLFPGQGSQSVGMLGTYLDSEPAARERFASASRILGYDLAELCRSGPAERLNLTLHTQPAMFTASSLLSDLLEDRGVAPDFVAGHSAGEFAALYACRALEFEAALAAVVRRAQLMHAAGRERPGAMAAVLSLPAGQVASICRETPGVVVVANDNSPTQVVISGENEAVAAAGKALLAAGARKVVPLPVSGAFHSPLMASAREDFVRYLAGLPWKRPRYAFVPAPMGGPRRSERAPSNYRRPA